MAEMELLMCDPELKPFIIDEVHPPSESKLQSLGSGSYGSVDLFVVGAYQLKCAGKSIHTILVEAENEGCDNIKQKFIRECKLMSSLRHPNIVQFLGVCFQHDSSLPILLMEYMTTNLESFIQASQSVSLSVKISILHDVAQGLAYLHSNSPPVIHRDLTATNILLNSSLSAKITDFGNSRLVDITPDQLARTMTCAPGTLAYLPPEALNPKPKYDAQLDSFSYGHLALYTMTQVFPMPSAPTFLDPETNKVIGRTEVERREQFLLSMESDDSSDHDTIKKLIINCLCNDPTKRPSSLQILSIMQRLRGDITDTGVMHSVRKEHSKGKLESPMMSNLVEDQTSELVGLCQTQQKLLELKEQEKQQQLEEIRSVKEQLAALERVCQTKDNLLQVKEAESSHLTKLVELKQKMITDIQSSNKSQAGAEILKKELKDIRSKLNTRKLEIEGWERLCQAKDKLLEERNTENKLLVEHITQKLVELGIDPILLQVEVDNGTPQSSEHKPEKVAPEEVTSKIPSKADDTSTSKSKKDRKLRKSNEKQTQHEDQKEPEEVDSEHIVKIVIMGDGASGKSCFLFAYSKNAFPECYIPTVFENYTASDYIHGHHFKFGLWDTAGQEDYDRLRPLSYPDTDCGLICFHIDNPQSLQNVSDKWVPEFRHHCPTTPFLIVGMKADLREDEYTKKYLKDRKLSFVSKEDGLALAKKVGAYTYAECSAKTLDGVRHVFEEVASCLLDEKKTRKKKQCIIQ